MRLQEEILVIWRCDKLIDTGARMGVTIAVKVALLSGQDIESGVVAFGDNNGCQLEFFGRKF